MKKKFIYLVWFLILLSGCTNHDKVDDENSIPKQRDYVQSLSANNANKHPLKAQIIGDRSLWVYQPVSHGKYIGHYFEKNKNDDFILYSSSVIGRLENNVFVPEQYVMAGSNKEFAYRAKPSKTTGNFYWFPEHENIGTVFAKSQNIYFDDIEQNLNLPGKIFTVESVVIRQNLEFIYPDTKVKLADLVIETEISAMGVTYHANGQWLIDTKIEKGYVAMLPTVTPLMKQLRTSVGNNYELKLENGLTDIPESDVAISYAYSSGRLENEPYSILLAEKINNINQTLRLNKSGRKEPHVIWLEHRNNGSVQKIYPQIYSNYIAKKDEKFEFSATVYTGLLTNSE